ncbi:glucose/galactose transporter WARNING family protein [Asticcacaulis biprosthecium C19]|uniref:Glucose/galactose transporter WARNING family protein n=1 Tax=Asticcacaulis biprosthecium C19 TaxID=715226 RepID=F4QL92_9CAUL|nr:sugar MFS transporter [Asticcacaulis biprosthecium]EGF93467.1 glucose/galactose transporter WARNING family protein [Asticcacaulis biprosthecium C19]
MSETGIATGAKAPQKTPWGAVFLFCLLFFIFGFVTWLNGPLITFVKLAFNLSDVDAFLVPSVFYLSYFFLSLPSAFLLRKTGMKRGMALGLLVMGIGAACFGQFATMRIFEGALTGLFIIGAGLSILQTAANPYISVLGPIESGAQRIAVMGIFNKFAGFLAPILVGTYILHGVGSLEAEVKAATDPAVRDAILNAFAARIHTPYMVVAVFLALMAVATWFSPLPAIGDDANPSSGKSSGGAIVQMLFGFFAIFTYVGVEVMAGDAITTYGNSFGLPLDQTKFFTSFTLVAMLVGYVAGLITIPRFISQERYLILSAILGMILTAGAFFTKGFPSVLFVAALGFANAMMWPAIFPLGIRGLGKLTEFGGALLVMGIAGGAVIPWLFAHLKETMDFQLVFLMLMVPCYAYILFFGLFAGRQSKAAG